MPRSVSALPAAAGPDRWALHVPLGKLHTERLVPADPELRQIVERILALRASAPPSYLAKSQPLLLPRSRRQTCGQNSSLGVSADREPCRLFSHVTPHRLRHSFATEMLRLGVSLPALMQLLGHKDIRMTLRYVEVTPAGFAARIPPGPPECWPLTSAACACTPPRKDIPSAGLPAICQALESTRHLLEMYRRQLNDEKTRRKLQRLDKRLLTVGSQLQRIYTEKTEETLAS